MLMHRRGAGTGGPPSSTFDPATTAWVNAVVANGGTVSAGRKTLVDTLLSGLRSDGVLSKLDRLWLFAGENEPSALTDLVGDTLAITHGTVSFSADHGYTGDGSTFYIDSGWKPTDGPNFTQNSASAGGYILTSDAGAANVSFIGQTAATNYDLRIRAKDALGNFNAIICDTTQSDLSVANANHQGFYIASRTGASATEGYKNGSSVTTGTGSSGALSAANVYIFANNGGSPGEFLTQQMSATFAGGGLSGADVTNLSARINAYMTSLGINVY